MSARSEHGVALPTPVIVLTVVSLVVALFAFFASSPDSDKDKPDKADQASPTAVPSKDSKSTPSAQSSDESSDESSDDPSDDSTTPARVLRAQVKVRVLNATSISGLAAEITNKTARKGWFTLEAGNTRFRPAQNTIYWWGKNRPAAELLGRDLGITKLDRSAAGMDRGRLIVVLVRGSS